MALACSEVDVVFLVDTGQHIDARCNPLQTSWNALPLKRGQFYFLVFIKDSNLKLQISGCGWQMDTALNIEEWKNQKAVDLPFFRRPSYLHKSPFCGKYDDVCWHPILRRNQQWPGSAFP